MPQPDVSSANSEQTCRHYETTWPWLSQNKLRKGVMVVKCLVCGAIVPANESASRHARR